MPSNIGSSTSTNFMERKEFSPGKNPPIDLKKLFFSSVNFNDGNDLLVLAKQLPSESSFAEYFWSDLTSANRVIMLAEKKWSKPIMTFEAELSKSMSIGFYSQKKQQAVMVFLQRLLGTCDDLKVAKKYVQELLLLNTADKRQQAQVQGTASDAQASCDRLIRCAKLLLNVDFVKDGVWGAVKQPVATFEERIYALERQLMSVATYDAASAFVKYVSVMQSDFEGNKRGHDFIRLMRSGVNSKILFSTKQGFVGKMDALPTNQRPANLLPDVHELLDEWAEIGHENPVAVFRYLGAFWNGDGENRLSILSDLEKLIERKVGKEHLVYLHSVVNLWLEEEAVSRTLKRALEMTLLCISQRIERDIVKESKEKYNIKKYGPRLFFSGFVNRKVPDSVRVRTGWSTDLILYQPMLSGFVIRKSNVKDLKMK